MTRCVVLIDEHWPVWEIIPYTDEWENCSTVDLHPDFIAQYDEARDRWIKVQREMNIKMTGSGDIPWG
jgi:hypothetical protein